MKTKQKKIPWEFVETRLPSGMGPLSLGRELGVEKNVVGNWKSRGVPLGYARDLSRILGVYVDEMLAAAGADNSTNSDLNAALSPEAVQLILCVARLDRAGKLARQTFAHHQGLLLLSEAASKMQDSPGEPEPSIEEVVRLLQSNLAHHEGTGDESPQRTAESN